MKIPAFEASAQRKLRVVGPCLLLAAIIVHVPTSYIDGPYRSSDDSFPSDVVITGSTTGELAAPARTATASFERGDDVLAPRASGTCLYPAIVLGASDEEVAIRFRFGRDGTAAPGDLIARPADAPPAPALGGRAVALLAGADVWAPGEVKSVRSQTQFLVELDQEF